MQNSLRASHTLVKQYGLEYDRVGGRSNADRTITKVGSNAAV